MPDSFSYNAEKAYYRQVESSWPLSYARFEPYLLSLVDSPQMVFSRKTVLEVGAGPAFYSRMIAEQFAPNRVIALDLVPSQFAAYRKENEIAGVLGIGGDCRYLPFHDKSFDVIFGSLIITRFRKLDEVLKDLRRILVDRGLYLGIEPSLMNPMHLFRQFFRNHSPNEFLMSGRQIHKAFSQCGFVVRIHRLAPRYPFLSRLGFATCIGIWAKKS